METLRGFVDAMWTNDPSLRNAFNPDTIWSKPDWASGNLELRRITTAQDKNKIKTDFYELYWAHLMTGTRLSHVLSWVWLLLFRRPAHVPKALFAAWLVLWAIVIVAVAVALNQFLPEDSPSGRHPGGRRRHRGAGPRLPALQISCPLCRRRGALSQSRAGQCHAAEGHPRCRHHAPAQADRVRRLCPHHRRRAQPRHHHRLRCASASLAGIQHEDRQGFRGGDQGPQGP